MFENRSLSPPWAPKGPQGPSGHQNILKHEGFSTLRLEKHKKTLCFSTPALQLETIWILKCPPIAPLSVQFWKGPAALAKPFGYPPPCLRRRRRVRFPHSCFALLQLLHSYYFAQFSHFVTFTSLSYILAQSLRNFHESVNMFLLSYFILRNFHNYVEYFHSYFTVTCTIIIE